MTEKYIYDLAEGDATMRNLLGGKGAGVAEMSRVGVPVPDAFTVTTVACVAAYWLSLSATSARAEVTA